MLIEGSFHQKLYNKIYPTHDSGTKIISKRLEMNYSNLSEMVVSEVCSLL